MMFLYSGNGMLDSGNCKKDSHNSKTFNCVIYIYRLIMDSSSQIKVSGKEYFPTLTGVRAIAAYMVFIHHHNPFTVDRFGQTFPGYLGELHIGVTLFFVLSGFLISYRYYEWKNVRFRKYMINRVARIYPVYFALTTLTFIVQYFRDGSDLHGSITSYILNITFLRGFSDVYKFSGIAQGWSLTVEETFYILAPLLFYVVRKKLPNILLLPVALLTFGAILCEVFLRLDYYGVWGSYDFMLGYTFFGRCTEFIIGMGLALYLKKKGIPQLRSKFITYLGFTVILISIGIMYSVKGGYEYGIIHPLGRTVNNFLMPLFGIAVFYYGLLTERTLIGRCLGSRLFILLGKSSYVFYLIHMGFVELYIKEVYNNFVVLFIILNILSILIFKYFEEPMNNYIRRKFR